MGFGFSLWDGLLGGCGFDVVGCLIVAGVLWYFWTSMCDLRCLWFVVSGAFGFCCLVLLPLVLRCVKVYVLAMV